MNQYKNFDLSYLQDSTGGDVEMIKMIMGIFKDQLPELYEDFENALQNKNWSELKSIAHKARNSTLALGMDSISQELSDLELTIVENEKKYKQLFIDFQKSCQAVLDELVETPL